MNADRWLDRVLAVLGAVVGMLVVASVVLLLTSSCNPKPPPPHCPFPLVAHWYDDDHEWGCTGR